MKPQKAGDFMLKISTIICALFVSSTAFAADTVTMSGCLSGGVEGCLFLKTPKGKYTLYVMPPRPSPSRGLGVTVTGTISNGPNFCMAGPGIVVQKWNYNRMRCPK